MAADAAADTLRAWNPVRIDPLLSSAQLAELAAEYGAEKLATDIVLLDMRGVVDYTDWFVVMSGSNSRQVQAIAEEVSFKLKKEHRLLPLRTEGMKEGQWVLVDFIDIVLHVFDPEARELYRLDELWGQVPHREVSEAPAEA